MVTGYEPLIAAVILPDPDDEHVCPFNERSQCHAANDTGVIHRNMLHAVISASFS